MEKVLVLLAFQNYYYSRKLSKRCDQTTPTEKLATATTKVGELKTAVSEDLEVEVNLEAAEAAVVAAETALGEVPAGTEGLDTLTSEFEGYKSTVEAARVAFDEADASSNLATAKTSAISDLEGYADPDDYRTAEQATLATAI